MNTWACTKVIADDNGAGNCARHPARYWNILAFHCCRCGKRRLFQRLYDVYPKERSGHFAMVCADCLIEVIS